jgi:hypothetical protein
LFRQELAPEYCALAYVQWVFWGCSIGEKPLKLTGRPFVMPDDASQLPPEDKRKLTICNLFANQKLSVTEIRRVLDEPYSSVIEALIQHQLIHDRRKNPPQFVKGERRISHFNL